MGPRGELSTVVGGRGQTNMDFAIGVGIFLLATAFVFTFVPSIVTPFDTGVGGAENAQADRIAATIIQDTGEHNVLDANDFESRYIYIDDTGDYIDELGLRQGNDPDDPFDFVNISVRNLGDGTHPVFNGSQLAAGEDFDEGRASASAGRIIRFEQDLCDPACRLVVRVW